MRARREGRMEGTTTAQQKTDHTQKTEEEGTMEKAH
jgi:hypothetical protein